MGRRLTPRGEQRRNELLAYATTRFAEHGYHQTSVAELVDGLGVGKGVFYWYFESKEDLFLEILRSGLRELRAVQLAASEGEADPLRRMELGIRASMAWWNEHRALYSLINFARSEATFETYIRKGEQAALADTRRLVEQAIHAGTIADADPTVIAQAVLGVSAVLASSQMLGRGRSPSEVADEVVDFCWHGLVGAAESPMRRRSA